MPPTPRTLRLRRGVTVSSRDDGLLLVGNDPEHRVLLPDTTAVARVLVQLRHGVPSGVVDEPDAAVVAALARAGLLVDVAEHDLLTAARAATRVRVLAPDPWRAPAQELLDVAGLGAATTRGSDLTWVVSAGAVPWQVHDDLVTRDEPTLFTAVLPSRVVVGPFVVPGSTACLRCTDTTEGEVRSAPEAGLEATAGDGLPEDLSPLLLRRALVLAVEDLCAWAEGRQPATWSATLSVADRVDVTCRRWRQHPHCGCSWSARSLTG